MILPRERDASEELPPKCSGTGTTISTGLSDQMGRELEIKNGARSGHGTNGILVGYYMIDLNQRPPEDQRGKLVV